MDKLLRLIAFGSTGLSITLAAYAIYYWAANFGLNTISATHSYETSSIGSTRLLAMATAHPAEPMMQALFASAAFAAVAVFAARPYAAGSGAR
jgi:hypothetical protein